MQVKYEETEKRGARDKFMIFKKIDIYYSIYVYCMVAYIM